MKTYDDKIVYKGCPEDGDPIIIVQTEAHDLERVAVPLDRLKWHNPDKETLDWYSGYLTLEEISNQLQQMKYEPTYLLIYESYTSGVIYRYGNHGAYWEKVGTMEGFA